MSNGNSPKAVPKPFSSSVLTRPAQPPLQPNGDANASLPINNAHIRPATSQQAPLPAALASNTVPGPASIAELARALKYNVDLIYEWVYSNVDYFPMIGIHKGAFGTLVDRVGGSFEQANLMMALLRQSGYTATFQIGRIRLTAAQLHDLLATDDSMVATTSEVILSSGQLNPTASYSGGVLQYIDFDHAWVQVDIGGTNYVFDPSFKTYSDITGVDLSTILGYNASSLISDAETGATVDPNYIQNLNATNIADAFTTYGINLLEWIKDNNFAASTSDITGGRKIIPLTPGTQLRQTALSYLTPGNTPTTSEDMPPEYIAAVNVSFVDASETVWFTYGFNSDEIYGRRLTLTFNGTNNPELRLDGELKATSATSFPDGVYAVDVSVYHPFPFSQTWRQFVRKPGTYVIGTTFGQVSQALVDYHRQVLNQLIADGNADTSEPVLGESLVILNLCHRVRSQALAAIYDDVATTKHFWYHFGGIVGYNDVVQGPYIDLAGIVKRVRSRKGDTSVANAIFTATDFVLNAFEAGIMQHSFDVTGVNTMRMMAVANAAGQKLFDATSSNWSTGFDVRSQLVNWDDHFTLFDGYISGGNRLIVHEDGHTAVDPTAPQHFIGGGYFTLLGGQLSGWLAGDIQGGKPGTPIGRGGCVAGGENTPPGTTTGGEGEGSEPGSNDPVGMFSGNYMYNRADLRLGTGSFPYSLEFSRHYNSANRFSDGPLGLGWTHNFATTMSTSSNPMRAIGEISPKEAVAAIAHSYVLVQLSLFSAPSLTKVLIAAFSSLWLIDQMNGNAVTLSDIAEGKTFIKLVDGTFNPPAGYADTLVRNVDGTYVSKNPQQSTWNFDANGRMTSYVWPGGVTRSYSYDGVTGKLVTVTTGMGRTLTFTYSGDRLIEVSDGNGRSISFDVDANGNLTTFTDAEGNSTVYEYGLPGQITKIFLPANPLVPLVTNTFDSLGRVQSQTLPNMGTWSYHLSGRRSEEVDPAGNSRVMYFSSVGSLVKDINAFGDATGYVRDGLNRLIKVIYPEGNSVEWEYDDSESVLTGGHDNSNNVLTKTYKPKPGSPLADVAQTFTYDPAWNTVATATDGRGQTTAYEYDATQGTLLSITKPTVGGETPVYTFTYNSRGQLLTRFEPVAGVSGIIDSFEYDTTTERLLSATRDFGTGRLNLHVEFDHDAVGNVISFTDARGNATTFQFDDERRMTQRQEATPFSFVTNYQYNLSGWLTAVQRQTSDPANPWQTLSFDWDAYGKLVTVTDPMNREFNFGYDNLGRLVTKTDAESRVWQFAYDEISRVTTVTDPLLDLAERRTYTDNGRLATTTDPDNNVTTFEWDGFDRMSKRIYPDDSFEQFGYDENSNVLTQVTRKGDSIVSTFDALNRLATRQPGSLPLQTFTFDLSGRPTKINTPVVSGDPTSGDYQFFYDTAGRLLQQRTPSAQNVSYELDENGNCIKLTWPDSYFVDYVFDSLNRNTGLKLNGSAALAVEFQYDALSRRISTIYENGSTCDYAYWANNDLNALVHSFVGSSFSFSFAYNNVHQMLGMAVSDDALLWTPEVSKVTIYDTANNLNEYPVVAAVPYSYDDNGCLLSDGVRTYTFDDLNRLKTAQKTGVTVSYLHDPLHRQAQKQVTQSSTTSTENYIFDGDSLIAQLDESAALVKRFVCGPRNEVLIQIAADGTKTFLHHDRLGSVIATSDDTGSNVNKFKYSPAGETPSLADVSFGFTGQKYEPEIGLYNYKTRYYDPAIGRFLQPDPLGYSAGDLNLYTYVDNDLVNKIDPLGLTAAGQGTGAQQLFGQVVTVVGNVGRAIGTGAQNIGSALRQWGEKVAQGFDQFKNQNTCLGKPQGPQPTEHGPAGGDGPVPPGPKPRTQTGPKGGTGSQVVKTGIITGGVTITPPVGGVTTGINTPTGSAHIVVTFGDDDPQEPQDPQNQITPEQQENQQHAEATETLLNTLIRDNNINPADASALRGIIYGKDGWTRAVEWVESKYWRRGQR